MAHFLCDRTLQKWLNIKLSNTTACLQFIEELKTLYKPENILLHRAFFTYEYVNKHNEKQKFDDRRTKIYININRLLKHYYDFFENNMPGIRTIELPEGSYYAWEEHEWGLAPMHYQNEYYERIYEEFEKTFNKQTVLI
ncbi:DUF6270 domain-containing protein [Bacillus massiliglaciei]|uniref:DUF6270 domain-containing protein n=1 Tax=Bacillus massiliglaciei TaxID=1816693 RepID=UPI0018FEAF58|nr:DUF6270 domain-containing protein [Bacillus massiliglaciei]